MKTLTMETAAETGIRRPLLCSECEGEMVWMVEITRSHPFGTGYEVLACEECGVEGDRKWTGF